MTLLEKINNLTWYDLINKLKDILKGLNDKPSGGGIESISGDYVDNTDPLNPVLNDPRPYKVYTALLTQSGTNAPVATVLENTLGVTVVWTRIAVGSYRATPSSSIFLGDKTFYIFNSNNQGSGFEVNSSLNDINDLRIYTVDVGELVDGSLDNLPVEVRVYN